MSELGRLGAQSHCEAGALVIEGGALHGGTVESHEDHRIAMACAIAALRASAPVTIAGHECVAKSFPDFFEKLEEVFHAGGRAGGGES